MKTEKAQSHDPYVSFVVVAWNAGDLTRRCLRSIFDNVRGLSFEVLLVDNGSTDGAAERIQEEFPTVSVLVNPAHVGFAEANNHAIRQARGKFLALLNNDALVTPNAIEEMVRFLEANPRVAAAGPQLLNDDGSKQNSVANFPSLATEFLNKPVLRLLFPDRHPSKYFPRESPVGVDSIIGACMVLRAQAVREVGLLDEDYYFFLEETDLCFRLRKRGWRVCHVPQARVYHYKGASAKRRSDNAARIEYVRSLYKFFEKNRSPAEFRLLRGLYSLKLTGELLLRAYAWTGTFLCHAESRRRLERYWHLLTWHWRLCPDSLGFGGKGSRR